ncbi:gamma-glutamylcyclotransferase [Synechococcus sp. Tobar12-5m-g]|uniref:gamma-glutamylcyclotransferase n=1 Tax=unclassified Synechococcus TaxID=2626047 RepID=UPI0020CD711C|nr:MULTISPECIES: gamma-glutamylcyclotransferase [unclassified Synechococcus]MCP9771172.1 gamma-glutamylcyclotransferase [Synechococcus sp. Tobar12-5m-g]MCP9872112.1 gamma-glutamylcyclotransferase [Synechococcus sp. Cruz CV-v-12]
MDASRQRVFVYGTLKRGESNHHWLTGATCLGRRRLAGAHLHDLGAYPQAVRAEAAAAAPLDPTAFLHGELYGVDDHGLARLDRLEDVPHDYERSRVRLTDGDTAWVYLGRPEQVRGLPLVPFGDWGTTPVFSYGSNLCPEQLGRRCPGWDGSGLVVRLDGWRWAICKVRAGRDGEGAAGIRPDPAAHCWGVVHHLAPADRLTLDNCEGVANGHYRHRIVSVTSRAGECFRASTYEPTSAWSAEGLVASADYAGRLLRGLAHWPLPQSWRQKLAGELGHRGAADPP